MDKKRIIPCLDLKDGRVVKGVKFVGLKDAGDPVEVAKRYNDMKADELVFLDIAATNEGRGTRLELITRTAENVGIPFCVGGGIRSVADIKAVLDAGASKASLNTAAFLNPEVIVEAAKMFGGEKITIAIDAAKAADGSFHVLINGGNKDTGVEVSDWAKQVEKLGAGEILLTSMDADGTKQGFDIELTKLVTDSVKIPVIASGGAGKKEDFLKVLTDGGADAALAASLFHFNEIDVPGLKKYLNENGVDTK